MKTKFPSQIASWKNAILLAITAFALSASPGSRADADCLLLAYWDNVGTGDWFDPLNWGPGHNAVPDCGECCSHPWEVDINNGGTAQISGLAQTARSCETFIGKDSGDSGKLSVDHGTLDQCSLMWVGYEGTGKLNITNGGLVTTLIGGFIAAATGSNGTATVDGTNSTWTLSGGSGVELRVGGIVNGGGGTGLLTVTNSGTIIAPSVHVYGSGTLTGNGAVTTTNGTTTMGGTLTPRAGTLTINGTLTFSSGATMECNVVPASADNVNVSGVASLAGKISVTMTGTTFTAGTTYTLLHSDGGLGNTQFQFVSIKTGTGDCFTPLITYDANNVKLYLSPCSN
jgi:T5SS/PEP-CTERM-associated repeat protein